MTDQVRVLVVDDSETDATVIRDQLIAQEYDVETLSDSREAYDEILEKNGYDLLVFDVNLPGLDGVTLAKRLRQQDILTPVLFLSGGVTPAIHLSITNMGPSVAYLEKGSSSEILIATCTELLARNRLVLQLTKQDCKLTEILEKIPTSEDLATVVASKLEDHCPGQHADLLEVGVAEQIGEAEERSSASIEIVSREMMDAIEESTGIPALLVKARDHSMVRIIMSLLLTIGTLYGGFTGYTYYLADTSSRAVIQVKSDVEIMSARMDSRMTQQTAQMNRIEEAVQRLSPPPPVPTGASLVVRGDP